MFNLIQFEILKRKKLFIILGTVFLLLQLYRIYSIYTNNSNITNNPFIGLQLHFLIFFISYIAFLYSSISNFFKDINSTDRTMVFMTPNSGFKIISSKFLATLILGLCLFLFTFLLSFANFYYISPQEGVKFINYLQSDLTVIKRIFLGVVTLGSFFSLVFLSIVITKTFLSKLKFKTLIVIVVMSLLSKIFNLIFWDSLNEISSIGTAVSTIIIILITTLMLWISGWLIDNKTDF